MACKHPFPSFSSLYILHYLDAVCSSENLHLLLFSNRVSFSTQKSLVYCKDLFLMAARENSAAIIAAGLLPSLQAWDLLLSFSELPWSKTTNHLCFNNGTLLTLLQPVKKNFSMSLGTQHLEGKTPHKSVHAEHQVSYIPTTDHLFLQNLLSFGDNAFRVG